MAESKGSFQADNLIKSLEDVFKNVPNLPNNFRELLVKITPWLALIFGILGIIGGLSLLGLSPVGALGGMQNGVTLLLTGALAIVSSVLLVMAFPKLNKREYAGWKLVFYSMVVSFVGNLLSLNLGSILWVIIWTAVGLYLLFQIKSYYK